MKRVDDWWVPDWMSGPHKYIARSVDMQLALDLTPGRDTVVQAGGHLGIWPVWLAPHFQHVHTFEMDAENYACLAVNCAPFDNIHQTNAALGRKRGSCRIARSTKSTGQHTVQYGHAGSVPVMTVDDMGLDACDLMVIDVEGAEMKVVEGAWCTIERFRPVLMLEENRRCKGFGYQLGDLAKRLRCFGYRLRHSIHEDLIFSA